MRVNVKGGTNARNRVVRQQPQDWTCPKNEGGCGKAIRRYWTKCPNCGTPRPE